MEANNSGVYRFLSDTQFRRLAVKGIDDPEWKQYESMHWTEREVIAEARLILLASDRFPKQTLGPEKKNALWNDIQRELHDRSNGSEPLHRFSKFRLGWAAAILILAGAGMFWVMKRTDSEQFPETVAYVSPELEMREVSNDRQNIFPVDLPDGSTILLTQNSRVRYSSSGFNGKGQREVYLDGEAFFEVVSNPESPFYVYTNGLTTKVLGTSFNVKAFPGDQQVEVIVKTGRVTVFPSEPGEGENTAHAAVAGEIVNPDERVVLDLVSRQLSLDRPDRPETKESEAFVFDDMPVTQVFSQLEKRYNITISYSLAQLKDCKITAALTDETLYEKIRLICKGLNATYQVVDGEIRIDSDGCYL